jgi:hypothetical protein
MLSCTRRTVTARGAERRPARLSNVWNRLNVIPIDPSPLLGEVVPGDEVRVNPGDLGAVRRAPCHLSGNARVNAVFMTSADDMRRPVNARRGQDVGLRCVALDDDGSAGPHVVRRIAAPVEIDAGDLGALLAKSTGAAKPFSPSPKMTA